MFVVFADYKHVPRTLFYTHEFNTAACMLAKRLLFHENENLSEGVSAKVYTHEIYPLYGTRRPYVLYAIKGVYREEGMQLTLLSESSHLVLIYF